MNVSSRLALFALLSLFISVSAFAQQQRVAVVTLLAGEVSYSKENLPDSPARLFMGAFPGDRFTLNAGAQIRVIYPEVSREEVWRGPVTIRVMEKQGDSTNGKPLQISKPEGDIPHYLNYAPDLIQVAKLSRTLMRRPGVPPPRITPAQRETIANAQKSYALMRTSASVGDIAPEMYLYAVLLDFLLYEEAVPVTTEMLKVQPDNEDIKALLDYVTFRASN
jgi:hypothetical protein